MDADARAMIERIARGGPDAIKSAIASLTGRLQAAEEPEPTTRAGWGRKEIRDLAAQGKQAVRTTHGYGIYGVGPCDVLGALHNATDKTLSWRREDGTIGRAALRGPKQPHTEPCLDCPDHPEGRFNEQNEKDHCSIHGSRLRDTPEGRWCESCRSS